VACTVNTTGTTSLARCSLPPYPTYTHIHPHTLSHTRTYLSLSLVQCLSAPLSPSLCLCLYACACVSLCLYPCRFVCASIPVALSVCMLVYIHVVSMSVMQPACCLLIQCSHMETCIVKERWLERDGTLSVSTSSLSPFLPTVCARLYRHSESVSFFFLCLFPRPCFCVSVDLWVCASVKSLFVKEVSE